jgi:hypothetical protein
MFHIPTFPEIETWISNHLPATYFSGTAMAVASIVLLLYTTVNKVLYYLSAPIRELPGPKSVNWLTGSLDRNIWEPDSQEQQIEWTLQYGPVFRYYGWFNVSAIL